MDMKIEIKKEVPFSDITSHSEIEFFPKDVLTKVKNDTSERNSDTEVNIKEETLLSNYPLQNKGTFLDPYPISNHDTCNKDTETEMKIKEEQWWLERNSTEIVEEFPLSDFTSYKETESFSKVLAVKIKNDTFRRNSDSEMNIKEEEETFLDHDLGSKLRETEKKLEIKEGWLEGNSVETSSAYDESEYVIPEHFPSVESPRSHSGVTSSSKSALIANERLEKNIIFSTERDISECGMLKTKRKLKTQINDVAIIALADSSVNSEQHDVRKKACMGPTESKYLDSSANIRDYNSCKEDSFFDLNGECTKEYTYGSKRTYKCNKCGKEFPYLCYLRVHNLIHEGIKPHKCDVCNKAFTRLPDLKTHKLIHEVNKPHKCDICSKGFSRLSDWKRHKLTHEVNKPHKCDVCSKSFTRLSDLKRHKFGHEGIKPHKCDVCGKNFTSLSHVKKHKLIHEGIKPHKCDVCGKVFTQLSHLRAHKLIHESNKSHKHDICGKDFTRLSQMKKRNLIHDSKRLHRCNTCGKDFTRLSNLKTHSLIHEDKRPYKCDICGKEFTQSTNLKIHNLIHEGKRPYKCDTCGKDFTQSSSLKTHKLIHEGIKPHKCDLCGKDFKYLSSLIRHKAIREGDKVHKCDICDKNFIRLSHLKRHNLIHEVK